MYDQAQDLRNQINRQKGNDACKTIAIISGKGGVGKSTSVLNLAIEFQKRGKKVLIFDLDIGMGNIDILIGQQAKYTIADFFEEFLSIHDMIEIGPNGLSYIAGGSAFNTIFELDEMKMQHFFSEYERLTASYDFIFFDLGAGINPSSLSFILSSDECFLVTTPEPTSIADGYSMIKHISRANETIPIYVIMNRSKTIREGHAMLKRFAKVTKEFLNKEIIQLGVLPYDPLVSQAVNRQTPYVILKENAAVSKAIRSISLKYLQLHEQVEEREAGQSFVQKLKQFLLTR